MWHRSCPGQAECCPERKELGQQAGLLDKLGSPEVYAQLSVEWGWGGSQVDSCKPSLKQRRDQLRLLKKKKMQSLEQISLSILVSTSWERQALGTGKLCFALLLYHVHLSANNYSPSRHPHLNLLIILLLVLCQPNNKSNVGQNVLGNE